MDEWIFPNIYFHWDAATQIASYRVEALNAAALTVWHQHVVRQIAAWHNPQPLNIIYNLTANGVGMAYLLGSDFHIDQVVALPQHKHQVEALLAQRSRLHICLALVLRENLAEKITARRAYNGAHQYSRLRVNMFFTPPSAREWLLSLNAANNAQTEA